MVKFCDENIGCEMARTCLQQNAKILSLLGSKTLNKGFVVYNNDQTICLALPQDSFARHSLKCDQFVYCIE